MKTVYFINNTLLILVIFFFNLTFGMNCSQQVNPVEEIDPIDSLINITHVKEQVILISFGVDAITAINTQEGIVLIDAGISTELTLKYKKIIERKFHSNDFRYLINTHYHPDHYGGNSVFSGAEVIGHENGIGEIMLQWKDTTKIIDNLTQTVNRYKSDIQKYNQNTNDWLEAFTQKMRYKCALNDAKNRNQILYPKHTFTDSMKMSIANLKFELIYFGKCHSNSDILVYVPELKLLFSGDLIFKYGRPSITNMQMVDKNKWLRAINWIETRISNIETIISGHGKILTKEDLISFNNIIIKECLN